MNSTKIQPKKPEITAKSDGDWGLDDWGSFDEVPQSKPSVSTKGKVPFGAPLDNSGWDEDWGTLDQSSKKTEKKEWNDWTEDWGETSELSKAELAKKKREERKQQRLQAMKERKSTGRGRAKLGAVKLQ